MNWKLLVSKRFFLVMTGLTIMILIPWLIVSCAKHFSKPPEVVIPLLHQGRRLIIPEKSPLRKLITIQTTTKQTIEDPFTIPAIVEADPATLIKVLPPLLGRISTLNKRLGDSVKTGEILFTIDSAELAQALSDLDKAKAALVFATQNLKRQQKLTVSNIAARHDTEEAQNNYEQAVSELARAKARLIELRVEDTGNDDKHVLVVRSPLSGHVIELNAAIGGYWNDTTQPIMTVADLSKVYITANAQEKDIGNIYPGQKVKIVLDAYRQPIQCVVHHIGAVVNPNTRTVNIQMIHDNKDGRLKPNMFAKAIFYGNPHKSIVLPLTAVIQRGFDSIVFIETAPWQFETRIVKTGAQLDEHIEIVSGLHVNERVVVTGGIILND
ncbi:TPA: efflux RND transporter periplasmic adaptor subunit [Legionella feeleii]|uniref:Cation efflux system protein n=1 Tax=Legionella feeleii TaxID=453 RepID=A0A378IUM5_9GAMM|nr:efflux RND transporter periplasmic adaptor subunit [Legionella feeleii]STX38849.1 cation efflux system protein [Legionella feeleii]